jgi:mono/diheme cytochrome c family protein
MDPVMERVEKRNVCKTIVGLLALSLLGIGGIPWVSQAADGTSSQSGTTAPGGESAAKDGACCKPGDATPPVELVANTPKGQLKSPYQDFAKVAEDGHHQFIRPGCNECHGGTGGGGICPPLTQGIWFWGSDDDTLFRLVTLGTAGLQKEGYKRLAQGSVSGPMPPMGSTIETSDDLWKIIAWIRSINPPPSPPAPPPPSG